MRFSRTSAAMFLFLPLGLFLTPGCKTTSSYVLNEVRQDFRTELLLSTPSAHVLRLEKFVRKYPQASEQDKITFLIDSIRSSQTVFIRNGDHYTGGKAAGWLRWKSHHKQYRDNPILTVRDFVERVAYRSKSSGQPYEIILPNGKRELLREVLRHELVCLDQALRKEAMRQAVSEGSLGYDENSPNSVQPSLLMPAASAAR